ncbi:MAG: glycine zipper 2TM domain-containing protein [Sulfuricaulis sp.]|nr:glycine zipper 2TM domain-containing protein [Sulfuricaulis sp.]
MATQVSKSLHPLAWIAGIAVILFSAAGIAAIMGWIPTSTGTPGNNAALEKLTTSTAKPAAPKARTAPAHVASNAPAAPQARTDPVHVASNAPARLKCAECGVIESVREIQHRGEGTGLGAVGGAVVGGLLGNQVGSGRGNTAATAIGAVGGVIAGNEIEKRVKSTKGYEITVRFDDGSSRVISAARAPAWRTGDKVKVINDAIQSNS